MTKRKSLTIVLDKALHAQNFRGIIPARTLEVTSMRDVPRIYNGPNADSDEDFQVIDAAFYEYATLLSTDYRVLAKMAQYHKYVVGHKNDRCLNGCIILPDSLQAQRKILSRLKRGPSNLIYKSASGKRYTVTWSDISNYNFGINFRSAGDVEARVLCEHVPDLP